MSIYFKAISLFIVLVVSDVLIGQPTYGQNLKLDWKSFEDAIEIAKTDQKPIMVDVWAPWCGWCKKMQKEVYPEHSETLKNDFILTRLNRDDNNSKVKYLDQSLSHLRLAQRFNVQSVPAVVFLSADGNYLFHVSGYVEPQKFKQVLMYID